jgi:tetratricopeptide (TPR) repeat protein
MWDPAEEYWGEEDRPIEEWAQAIITKGPRPLFEMEQILPGEDPEDFDSDPIIQANELRAQGRTKQARELPSELVDQDVRCLDAHAHLGSMEFDQKPARAIEHYQRGVEIGRLSLGKDFSGVLPWGMIDHRPFLRCLRGFGLCLWRLGRFEEAGRVFDKLLWLSPSDNLGVRFVLPACALG